MDQSCIPVPREPGTPCGVDDDFYFGVCNEGPGFCKTIETEFGQIIGICVGVPKIGESCDDLYDCTKDDKCEVITTDDGVFSGICVGKFDENIPCDDRNDCTINDRCGCTSA
jgi:hypothetical protein